jgi:hypothetical protein
MNTLKLTTIALLPCVFLFWGLMSCALDKPNGPVQAEQAPPPPPPPPTLTGEHLGDMFNSKVYVIHDERRRVTCWVMYQGYADVPPTLSCLADGTFGGVGQ